MKQKAVLLCLFVFLLFYLEVGATSASSIAGGQLTSTSSIVLEETSNITVTSWLGAANCNHGQIWLLNPKQINLVSKNFELFIPGAEEPVSFQLLIPDYGSSRPQITFGPYPVGTEVRLALSPGSFCDGFFTSDDRVHAKLRHHGGGSWTISWEDRTDFDYNDVYTEITLTPISAGISDEITAVEAFSFDPVYQLPWPAAIRHKLTSYPGYSGEHKNINAYDFAMKSGDLIVASEKGLVLWVEDSFGEGGCNPKYRNRANLVVIQTEGGTNQTYVHLQKGSVTEFALKPGDTVEQGQIIGRAGNSGYSCSSSGGAAIHLHIEWQHHCYDLEQALNRRPAAGTPTLKWSCPGFIPDSPYNFTISGKTEKISNINKEYISDNSQKP